MISTASYFGDKIKSPDATEIRQENSFKLLFRVNTLLRDAESLGVYVAKRDPDTGSQISGTKNGAGDGGFRLSTSLTGSPKSSHREGKAVDVYDPGDLLDNWLTDKTLETYGLYREHPDSTPGWCHLQTNPPGSGNRTYRP